MKMTTEMFEEYMKQLKENERLRLSTNERDAKWRAYIDNIKKKGYRAETSFDMNKFSKNYVSKIKEVDGFILKSASPSCGVKSTKIFQKKHPAPLGKGNGLFAEQVIKSFPNHPIEEEKRLNNHMLREHFFTSIFTIANYRNVKDFESIEDQVSKIIFLATQ